MSRTLSFQAPDHVARRLDEYLAKEWLISGRRPTVKSVLLEALEQYLAREMDRQEVPAVSKSLDGQP